MSVSVNLTMYHCSEVLYPSKPKRSEQSLSSQAAQVLTKISWCLHAPKINQQLCLLNFMVTLPCL